MRTLVIKLALQYAGIKILLIRKTLPELKENHIIPLRTTTKDFAIYKDIDKSLIFANGSRIKMGYCASEKDIYQYQGQEYDVVCLEEATHFTCEQRDFIMTCNRSTRKDFKPRMYYTCNPGGVGMAWVKRLFIDREYRNAERAEDYNFIRSTLYDNHVLMNNNPEYEQALLNLPEDLRKAHLYGDWNVFSGQFFKEFRTDKHVIEPLELPSHYARVCSIDWGYSDACAVYWGAVFGEHIYIYRELHINETLASDIAEMIVDLSSGEDIEYLVGGVDMWQQRGQNVKGESIADEFYKVDLPLVKADNSRIVGWQRIREFLKDSNDGFPHLQIFSTCEYLVKHLPKAQYDKHRVEDISKEPHEITNSLDSLRYLLMSRPQPNNYIAPSKFEFGTMEYKLEQHRKQLFANKQNKKKDGIF